MIRSKQMRFTEGRLEESGGGRFSQTITAPIHAVEMWPGRDWVAQMPAHSLAFIRPSEKQASSHGRLVHMLGLVQLNYVLHKHAFDTYVAYEKSKALGGPERAEAIFYELRAFAEKWTVSGFVILPPVDYTKAPGPTQNGIRKVTVQNGGPSFTENLWRADLKGCDMCYIRLAFRVNEKYTSATYVTAPGYHEDIIPDSFGSSYMYPHFEAISHRDPFPPPDMLKVPLPNNFETLDFSEELLLTVQATLVGSCTKKNAVKGRASELANDNVMDIAEREGLQMDIVIG